MTSLAVIADVSSQSPAHASPRVFATTPPAYARVIRNAAVRALQEEVITYPKPGLVSLVDAGSHTDMDATTFARSTLALRHYFSRIAMAGAQCAPFAVLRCLGIEAETGMLRATRGVNTHRGAIFNLGLLAAAAGYRASHGAASSGSLGAIVQARWGSDLAQHRRDAASHGSRVSAAHGAGGARAEALAGFPSLYSVALPAYRAVLGAGLSANQARVQAFFALLARLDDTNLLHRGGAAGLAFARNEARRFLAAGGVYVPAWRARAVALHQAFCTRRLSPGGSADLLAACMLVHRIEG